MVRFSPFGQTARSMQLDFTIGGRAMSYDLVMRTLGVLTCLYTVAYFVTTMSVAALNGVTYNSGPMCGQAGCVSVAAKQHAGPRYAYATDDAPLWTAASYLPIE
jgi:hypothetical protein